MEAWTWEIVSTELESDTGEAEPVQSIEIIVRHEAPALVYRLTQILRVDESSAILEPPASVHSNAVKRCSLSIAMENDDRRLGLR